MPPDGRAPFEPAMFTLLVVDDEPMNREMLSRRLERKGYVVMNAADGPRALEKIEAAHPDLVLLDIMMPGMSGVEVLEELRRRYGPEELPVIMASAKSEADDIVGCLARGANDYVTKPLDFPIVLARIEAALRLKSAVEESRSREAQFRLLADMSADLISLHAPDGRFRYASPACLQILGYEPDELYGVVLQDLVHPRDRAAMPQQHASLSEVGTLIIRMRRKDDRYVWVEILARTIRGSRSGKVTDIQCTTRDVTAYVDRMDEPPAARGADFVGKSGWRTPTPATTAERAAAPNPTASPLEPVGHTSVPPIKRKPTLGD